MQALLSHTLGSLLLCLVAATLLHAFVQDKSEMSPDGRKMGTPFWCVKMGTAPPRRCPSHGDCNHVSDTVLVSQKLVLLLLGVWFFVVPLWCQLGYITIVSKAMWLLVCCVKGNTGCDGLDEMRPCETCSQVSRVPRPAGIESKVSGSAKKWVWLI